jgi:hypothetical protein
MHCKFLYYCRYAYTKISRSVCTVSFYIIVDMHIQTDQNTIFSKLIVLRLNVGHAPLEVIPQETECKIECDVFLCRVSKNRKRRSSWRAQMKLRRG